MRWSRLLVLFGVSMLATGCWDRVELNDLAFDMGLALDLSEDGKYEASAQIAVPSQLAGNPAGTGGGGQGKGYFVVTGRGEDTGEAIQEMQEKLSRRIHEGHRRVIFIGEKMAAKGIAPIVDLNARDPEARLRTDMFVVRGGQAVRILNVYYPFERVPAIGAIKLHRVIGATEDASYRDFLIKAFDSSSSPTLPVIEEYRESTGDKQGFRFGGRAIFNKSMQLIGFMNSPESIYRAWITGQTNREVIIMPNPQGKGRISLLLTRLGRTIRPMLRSDGKVVISVTLTGRGEIRENVTDIDLTQKDNLRKMELAFDKYSAAEALGVIRRVQKEYSADVFGFGRAVHRAYPNQWRSLQRNWSRSFPDVEVVVESKLSIERIGLTTYFLETKQVAPKG